MIPPTMQTGIKPVLTPTADDVARHHLAQVLASNSFSSSRRCQQFLSFVVKEALEGRADSIKERTIAMEVFGKDQHFEPGEDSLVRVKAREVRKRLAEFYEQHPDAHLKIDLPLGGYIPRFQQSNGVTEPVPRTALYAQPVERAPSLMTRRKMLWAGGACAAAGLAAWPISRYLSAASTPLDQFWEPIFATHAPLLISIPLLNDEDGAITERVGLGAAAAANEAAEFLASRRYPSRLRFGSDFTFSQLREQPSLLLGGFSSQWTDRITKSLRYHLVRNTDGPGGSVRDAQTGKIYGPINTHNGYAPEDYALVCRLFDAAANQIILVAAGITTFGTESAARFFFRPELFEQLIAGQNKGWQKKNFQALIHISIIETTPSAPTIVATNFW
jgi:hypothetical protein